jgi:hypothetical protein
LIPQKLTASIRRKILDNIVDEVSEALSMHVAPPAIQIVVAVGADKMSISCTNMSSKYIK